MRSIQTMHSLRPADRIIIFLGAIFTDAAVTAKEITNHKKLLAILAPSAIQQRHLIAGFEWFCGARYPALIRFFPILLKELFDEEIVEEDIFFNWAADYPRNEYTVDESMIQFEALEQLKSVSAPFITWLQEAEEVMLYFRIIL